ncbi:unnamed protein product [Clavelina lepadiformis]|uniref:Major facilitator superfamily (MFS) profile domain-containing protein n=1 Tax=Clavelina lepadiformis TaxID=159417 RepID=A0ABP0F3S9_CLALP
MYDFDVILKKIGGFGRIQAILTFMICFSAIPSGLVTLAPVFIQYRPDYRCRIPILDERSSHNLSEEQILNFSTPFDPGDNKFDFCFRFPYNDTSCNANDVIKCFNTSAEPEICKDGYYYDRTLFSETVVTEFNIVCENRYLDTLATSLFMAGRCIGTILCGYIADRFGRKKTIVASYLACFVAVLSCSFVHEMWMFILLRTMTAFFDNGSYVPNFLYLLEMTSEQHRSIVGLTYQISFSVGYMLLSGLAYYARNWHHLEMAIAMCMVPYLIFLLFIPESPRWLFSRKRNVEAMKITRRFARCNKVRLSEADILLHAEVKEKDKISRARTYTTKDLFKTPKTRIVTLKILFLWVTSGLVYYGISLNASSLSGNIFINNCLSGVMETVAYFLIMFLMNKTGRRWMLIFLFALAGLGLLVGTALMEIVGGNESVIFFFIGKFGIAGAYAVIYNFTTELYPTVTRGNGVSAGATSANLASVFAPVMIELQDSLSWLPNVLFGVMAVIATFITYTMPETGSRNMCETIEEAEIFYAGKRKQRVSVDSSSSML